MPLLLLGTASVAHGQAKPPASCTDLDQDGLDDTTGEACFVPMAALLSGADATYQDGYREQIKAGMAINPGGDAPFGESLNLYTGELSFLQSDVVVKGKGPTIVLARLNQLLAGSGRDAPLSFGGWNVSIPRIEVLVETPGTGPGALGTVGINWRTLSANSYDRCTSFSLTSSVGTEWFTTVYFVDEGGSTHELLTRDPGYAAAPSISVSGTPISFPIVTQDQWQVGCLPQTANASLGETAQAGEAFLAVSPDGTKYFLNYAFGERAFPYKEDDPAGGPPLRFGRMLARMYVTRIEDRFGNYLTYNYTAGKLQSIIGSDGRSVTVAWRSDVPVISSVTVNASDAAARVWQYGYTGVTSTTATLATVTLPDNSQWAFSNVPTTGGASLWGSEAGTSRAWTDCGVIGPMNASGSSSTATITNPAGLTGTFVTSTVFHGRSYVPSACIPATVVAAAYEGVPAVFGSQAVTSRAISGPGVSTQTWTYTYSAAQGSHLYDPCASTNTCADTATVTITEPSGDKTVHIYSTRWGAHEGKLLQTQTYQGASTLLRTVTNTYAASNLGPWPNRIGASLSGDRTNVDRQETWTPTLRTDTIQQGRTFTWRVAAVCFGGSSYCFDTFARPTQVVKSSAP